MSWVFRGYKRIYKKPKVNIMTHVIERISKPDEKILLVSTGKCKI